MRRKRKKKAKKKVRRKAKLRPGRPQTQFSEAFEAFRGHLKMARTKSGISQKKLGEKIHVSEITIRNIERGVSEPSFRIMMTIARIFKIRLDSIKHLAA